MPSRQPKWRMTMGEDFVRRVLREHARANMTRQPNLWPALSRLVAQNPAPPSKRSWMRPWFSAQPLVVAGLLVLLVAGAIGTAALLNQPKLASAAEVIAKAQQVAQDEQSNVQSFHGVMTEWFIAHEPAGVAVEGRMEQWYQAEPYKYINRGTYRRSDGSEYHTMSGADEEYTHLAHEEDPTLDLEGGTLVDGVLKRPVDPDRPRLFGPYNWLEQVRSSGKGDGTNGQKFNYLDLFDKTLVGTERIAGRDVYVLELTANPAGRGYPSVQVPVAKSKMWVDQQLFFVLRGEAFDANGELTARYAFETIEFNQPIDPSVFDFSAPEEASE